MCVCSVCVCVISVCTACNILYALYNNYLMHMRAHMYICKGVHICMCVYIYLLVCRNPCMLWAGILTCKFLHGHKYCIVIIASSYNIISVCMARCAAMADPACAL